MYDIRTVQITFTYERRTPLSHLLGAANLHVESHCTGGGVRVGHAAGGSNADVNEVITLCTAVQISQFNLTSLRPTSQ